MKHSKKKSYQSPFALGELAFTNNESKSTNPFTYMTPEWAQWRKGWEKAEEEDRKNDKED